MRKFYAPLLVMLALLFICNIGMGQLANDSATTKMNKSVVIDVRKNDPVMINCIFTVDYSICCGAMWGPQNGAITILNLDSIKYTPNNGFVGTDRFYYGVISSFNPNPCDTAVVFISITHITGHQELHANNNLFSIHPNPTDKPYIYITFQTTNISPYEVTMFNVTGATIKKSVLNGNSPHHRIAVADLPQGIYFIEVRAGQNVEVQKVVLQN